VTEVDRLSRTLRHIGMSLLVAFVAGAARAQIVGSAHNLSVSGPGPFQESGEEQVCIFCHAPHLKAPKVPMWNRRLSALTYTLYSSSTMVAIPDQPTGASKLCLSCHDGTIALGEIITRVGGPVGPGIRIADRGNLSTDLSDDHPISFTYDSALAAAKPELVDPAVFEGGPVKLDSQSQLQCTSCHDAHSSIYPNFLLASIAYGDLCLVCHDKNGWESGAHATSQARATQSSPWPHAAFDTVAEGACQSCHTAHGAGQQERLLLFEKEEDNCLSCHDGTVASTDLVAELRKRSTHAVDRYFSEHDPIEDPASMPPHVECWDCHNPHAASASETSPPFVMGAMWMVPGETIQGTLTDPAQYEYEVCLRCHSFDTTSTIGRQVFQPNVALQFGVANPSFHPVASAGRNPGVPSLLNPWTEASVMYCTDCHSNDDGPGAFGNGPRGPHGSRWPFLLERQYTILDGFTENQERYALCYKCHERTSILGDESFPTHALHIRDARTSCATCHDPHGISLSLAGAANHTHLINFATNEVEPNAQGEMFFEERGILSGSCSLRCHDFEHDDLSYSR
jgi:predicted CXXCH cytochrome family protein